VADVANERGVLGGQAALAWVLSKTVITAPIVGATKPQHIEDAVPAIDLDLSSEEIDKLEAPHAPYAPYHPAGF
jgi:1-deoxyxylulose-5-phosphate synthase